MSKSIGAQKQEGLMKNAAGTELGVRGEQSDLGKGAAEQPCFDVRVLNEIGGEVTGNGADR